MAAPTRRLYETADTDTPSIAAISVSVILTPSTSTHMALAFCVASRHSGEHSTTPDFGWRLKPFPQTLHTATLMNLDS